MCVRACVCECVCVCVCVLEMMVDIFIVSPDLHYTCTCMCAVVNIVYEQWMSWNAEAHPYHR